MSHRQQRTDYYAQLQFSVPLCWPLVLAYAAVALPLMVLLAVTWHGRWWTDLAILFVAWLGVALLSRGTLRRGITVDDEGLCEWYPLGLRRRLPWSAVQSLDVRPTATVLHAGRRALVFDGTLQDSQRLIEQCRARLEPNAATGPGGGEVAAEAVAGWLGLAAGETFHTALPAAGTVVRAIGALTVVGLWFAYTRLDAGALWFAMLLPFVARVPASRRRTALEVSADGGGLRVRLANGWIDVGWDDFVALDADSLTGLVQTRRGDFWLSPNLPDVDHLRGAIRHALLARRRGDALPRLADVPDAALSRVTGTPADAERGLSEVR